jgi:hypothetical protein
MFPVYACFVLYASLYMMIYTTNRNIARSSANVELIKQLQAGSTSRNSFKMNFANPHFFSAILDGIKHRFILIQECESVAGAQVQGIPRFSVGALNATKDPRFATSSELVEVGVSVAALEIPPGKSRL